MTIAVVLLLVALALAPLALALLRRRTGRGRREAGLALHHAQLAELDRDLAEGRIGGAEHTIARLEVQRRLLTADALPLAEAEPGWRGPLLAAFVLVPLVAAGLYYVHGRPDLPAAPLAARDANERDAQALVERLRERIADPKLEPERAREGFVLLGNTEEALGRLPEAAAAWRQAVRLRFDPGLAALAAEAQTRVDGGKVSMDSGELFRRALESAPADAPWRPIVQQRLQAFGLK